MNGRQTSNTRKKTRTNFAASPADHWHSTKVCAFLGQARAKCQLLGIGKRAWNACANCVMRVLARTRSRQNEFELFTRSREPIIYMSHSTCPLSSDRTGSVRLNKYCIILSNADPSIERVSSANWYTQCQQCASLRGARTFSIFTHTSGWTCAYTNPFFIIYLRLSQPSHTYSDDMRHVMARSMVLKTR